jgi:glycosyltransferase involved in cell wall biosynthesis
MRIGVEARWFFDGPPSGRRVVRSIVSGLANAAAGDEVHVFLDERARSSPLPSGIAPERCHYVRGGNGLLTNVFAVPRAADRLKLDVVIYQNFVPPRAAARHARVAYVHGVIFDSHPEFFTARQRLYFSPLRALAAGADRVCTGTNSESARLVRLRYANADRIDVTPPPVDTIFLSGRDASRGCATRLPARFVLFVGRLNARNNVATLVRAMAHVRDREIALVIVGQRDATSADITGIARAAGVADRVHIMGAVPDKALRAVYAHATVFCFPSLDDGFGMPPLEAMALGAPVIASRIPAVVESCGDAAMYVEPRDERAFAAAIDSLATDQPRRDAQRAAGFQRAGMYTAERFTRGVLASVRAAAHR